MLDVFHFELVINRGIHYLSNVLYWPLCSIREAVIKDTNVVGIRCLEGKSVNGRRDVSAEGIIFKITRAVDHSGDILFADLPFFSGNIIIFLILHYILHTFMLGLMGLEAGARVAGGDGGWQGDPNIAATSVRDGGWEGLG